MKFWKDQYTFSFPWEIAVQAANRKYPTKHNPNVQALDVLERYNRPSEHGKLYSHRLFTTLWNVPNIVLKILGANTLMYVQEQSECDIKEKTLTIAARNLSVVNLFRMEETLLYQTHPDDPSKTLLVQTAKFDIYGIPIFGDMLESLLVKAYSGTVAKGRSAVEEKAELIINEVNSKRT